MDKSSTLRPDPMPSVDGDPPVALMRGDFTQARAVQARLPLEQARWRSGSETCKHLQKPSHSETEVAELVNGLYECPTCMPPYKIKADGHDQPLQGNPYYDTISVAIVDDHSITKIAKKHGTVAAATAVTVSADGATKTEVQTLIGIAPATIELTAHYSRVRAGKQ